MKTYQPRLLDSIITRYFSELPALVLEGAKGVGKTVTASRYAAQILQLDIDDSISLLSGGLAALRALKRPLLLDEWQRYPQSWDYVRRLVDEDNRAGQFLLTGSAEQKSAPTHSGAARIVRLRMRPLSLAERFPDAPVISLADVLADDPPQEINARTDADITDYISEIVRSGFPGLRALSPEMTEVQLDSYLTNIIHKEFPENDLYVRKPEVLKQWLRAYAAATASTTSYQKIMNAATAGETQKPAKTTTTTYRDALDSLWITDRVEAWLPSSNAFTALGKAPKHFLLDPAISARLLRINAPQLLQGTSREMLEATGAKSKADNTVLGRLFEALLALSLQTYAFVNRAELRHFRSTKGDREIDFIIERDFTIVAIEVKLSAQINDDDAAHLNWLEQQYPEYQVRKLIINTGTHAYTRKDGTHVIPALLLGA